ncbi:sodium-dependent transporter (symport) [Sulfurimonas gotlandica GD1]|uniref:Sodium-dependent transporter (Symport) n=1 Tax=Sulfurimonas gotlandica (strain DSM 19862 / JCM 16533 / GD1) TaxID=929558 RepID=B6BMN5_SULGG|nr:SLC13 family permease [Sulfurimonas gotlandica]EDZ61541.1 sodium/sulphate symporter [Sulfurimonas gotlandica GD1]EHP30848.1 sodium-dependent transporter (symport) [Sulfurimonas gotlandica GD1]
MSEHKEQFQKIGIGVLIGIFVFAISLFLFNPTQASLLGLIAFLVALWTNEGLPLAVVSLLPIVLFPAFSILDTKATAVNYSHPIIFLFLGGFLLAIAVEKSNLHTWIADKMLGLFPNTPRGMIFSLAITSGLLSSILSNTTTTLLLMSIALFITDDIKLKLRFALAIAYGASVGGIMTPIGTPPNLILLGIMSDKGMETIPFFQWVWMVAPLAFLMFIVVSMILSLGVPNTPIHRNGEKVPLNTTQKKVLYITGGLVFLLLLNAPMKPFWGGLGLSEAGILLSAGLLLFMPPFNVLEWMDDKAKIPYRIMFLFGAGFSIAKAFSATGLASEVASYLIVMTELHPIVLLFAVATLITFTTEITSNTALISIMLPVIYSVAQQTGINTTLFMMVATLCASYAFMLPIATPPNAIAMSSGVVDVKSMIRYGIVLNLVGIFLIVMIAEFFWKGILT